MATWTDPTTLATDPDDPVTSELLTATKNNPVAMAEQQSGAPKIASKNLFGSGGVSNVDLTVTDFAGGRFVIQARSTGGVAPTIQVNVSDGTFGTAQTLATVPAGGFVTISGYWDEATGSVQGAFGSDGAAPSIVSATVTKTSGITTLRFTGVGSSIAFSVHLMPDGGESAS